MSFNVSGISKFTNEIAQGLIKKAVATGRTIDLVSIQPGIKYKETINILDNTISVRNATCGFSSNGSVAIKQRTIEVVALEIKESLCEKTLEQYFLGQSMRAGAPKDEELGMILADSYVQKVQKFNEGCIWGGTNSTNQFTGLVTLLTAEGTRVTPAGMSASYTSANIVAHVDKMVAALPEDASAESDLSLFMSFGNYNLYTAALRTANLYNYDGANGSDYSCLIPGTSVRAYATTGLSGTTSLVLTPASNIVVGMDLQNEEEKFVILYSQDNDEVRVNIQWKMGVQVKFPEWCVCSF